MRSLVRAKNAFFLISAFMCGVLAKGSGVIDDIDAYWDDVTVLVREHLWLLAVSGALATVVGIVPAILLSRLRRQRAVILVRWSLDLVVVVPALVLLALVTGLLGKGQLPAITALAVVALLPIVRYTYNSLHAVPAELKEAARGLGMGAWRIFWWVELPNALAGIFAGVQRAMVVDAAAVPLVYLIGGGGLGELIFTGLELGDRGMLLAGGLAAALLAFGVDFLLGLAAFWLIPRGVNPLR